MTELTANIIREVQAIPPGRVASYGEIARRCGSPRAARQVVRVLHSYSGKLGLPWQRVVGAGGSIRLRPGFGLEEQVALLRSEGVDVRVSRNGSSASIDMAIWGRGG